MCGILGCFNVTNAKEFIEHGLQIQNNRGKDGYGFATQNSVQTAKEISELSIPQEPHIVAHSLHSIVSHVKQPLRSKGTLVANCEIYNYKEFNSQAPNDAHVLLELLDKNGVNSLEQVNGVYACAYWKNNTVTLTRDIIGEKPLHYYYDGEQLYFASELKTLLSFGLKRLHIQELNPRQILTYDIQTKKIDITQREFFTLKQETQETFEEIVTKVETLLDNSLQERLPDQKVGILFSGGIDSTILAWMLKQKNIPFTCYTAGVFQEGMELPEDIVFARKAAKDFGFEYKEKLLTLDETKKLIPEVIELIESSNVVKVGVALPFYAACQIAKEDGIRVMLSGLGSEEIFAGYERHTHALDVNKECISGLRKMYERDLYRDDVITMHHTIELRLPFLDKDLITYALTIPAKYKIKDGHKKYILRHVAQKKELPDEFAFRPKKAAQYGSKFDKALMRIAKQEGYISKSAYLDSHFPQKNQRLACLLSGGKDSIYALYTMQQQNYPVSCAITIESENDDSYMFHTPNTSLTQLQADSLGIPLIRQTTKGEKEEELVDLEKAIRRAKEEYNIDGLITGALYSTYQRERIETIAEKLGLKVFSPLWHINQAEEMYNLISRGFKVILTAVGAEGLDETWLNRVLTHEDVKKLEQLNEKIGLNIAGEGGEFESLVLDGPNFEKELIITQAEIRKEKNSCVAKLYITDAKLHD